jgi:hypothetical protein
LLEPNLFWLKMLLNTKTLKIDWNSLSTVNWVFNFYLNFSSGLPKIFPQKDWNESFEWLAHSIHCRFTSRALFFFFFGNFLIFWFLPSPTIIIKDKLRTSNYNACDFLSRFLLRWLKKDKKQTMMHQEIFRRDYCLHFVKLCT